jgi:hypothetical protein
MEDDTTRTETCEMTDEGVLVERTVEYLERGVTVTLRAESRDGDPASFRLVEEFPEELPVSDAGFQPGTEPAGGRIDADGVLIEGTVEPDEECTVVYALQLFEPAPEATLGRPELTVPEARAAVRGTTDVLARGGGSSATAASVPAPGTAGESMETVVEPLVGGGSADGGGPGSFGGAGSGAGDENRDGAVERSGDPPVIRGPRVPGIVASGSGSAPADRSPGATEDGGVVELTDADVADAGDAPEGAPDGTPTGDEEGEPVDEATSTVVAVESVEEPTGEGTDDETTDGVGESGGSGEAASVTAGLLAELRDGAVSDEELAGLRRELGVGHATGDDVRIAHLESRMSEFAAYADALRTVIDEHGTAEEFVARFADGIDGLRDDLDAVESELSATRETLAGVEDDLETLTGDLESLAERTDAEFETVREEVASRHGETTEALDRLEGRLDAVESLREGLASVFDDLGEDPN